MTEQIDWRANQLSQVVGRFYILYSAISALEQTYCALVVYLQRCLVVTWLVPRETAAVSARSVYIMQPYTMSRHCRFYCSAVQVLFAIPTLTPHFASLLTAACHAAARSLITRSLIN